jgi:hypothetical protein
LFLADGGRMRDAINLGSTSVIVSLSVDGVISRR